MNLAPNVGDPSSAKIPLSGIIGRADSTPYADENAVCDYTGAMTSTMKLQGNTDASAKYVVFRIGVRQARANMARPADDQRIDTSMPIVEEVRRTVQEMGRRSTAMPVTWDRMDLFGVVRRLAMGCAYYSVWGGITAAELRGGGNVSVAAIAAVIDPIAADAGAVFASAKLVGHAKPNVMAALVNAVSGEGGTLYTDLLGVNAGGAVQVPNAQNAALAQGCHDALRVLGAMYKACNKGAFFALAVTEGVHRVLSVHGHCDEGAYVRTVLRRKEAGVPYGAIVTDMDPDNALPNPMRSVAGFRAVYHAIAIATAGAVALADPMVDFHGRDYPTILVTDQGNVMDPGTDNNGDANDAADLTTQWAEACGAWSRLYAKALAEIFVTAGGVEEAERHLVSQANSMAGQDDRHLRQKVAVAFSWVEPTCACPVGDASYPAYVACHGPLATTDKARTMPALDGCALLADRSDNWCSTVQVDFRYARRHGLLVHLNTHSMNGMGSIILETGVVNDLLLVGGAGDVGPRILNGDALGTYMWGRGQSSIVAPGELISLSKSNVLTFMHLRQPRNGVVRNNHVPTGTECIEAEVTMTASRLAGGAPAAPGGVPARDVRRARSRAAIALSMASDAARHEYTVAAQLMQPSLIDYGELPATSTVTDPNDPRDEDPGPGAADGAYPVAPDADVPDRAGHLPAGPDANGPNAPVRIENRRDRGPRPPRPGPVRGGGQPPGNNPGGGGGGYPPGNNAGGGGGLLPLPPPPPPPPRPPPVPPAGAGVVGANGPPGGGAGGGGEADA